MLFLVPWAQRTGKSTNVMIVAKSYNVLPGSDFQTLSARGPFLPRYDSLKTTVFPGTSTQELAAEDDEMDQEVVRIFLIHGFILNNINFNISFVNWSLFLINFPLFFWQFLAYMYKLQGSVFILQTLLKWSQNTWVYLPTLTHYAWVSHLWAKNIDLTHQPQFLMPESQIATNKKFIVSLHMINNVNSIAFPQKI